ncbi:UNVERIFIED_CONTAM: Transposon Tf2-11 polyprotein [Sesamum radiatum]|uniref:Transposon Tf2-11 polyprotein n=1 Tax=Sesamum radiatum TaxID=300843 RepID=A0AAW2MGH0_SESRA
MKQPSKPQLKGCVPSTQEEKGGHEALAIDQKGNNPKEKLSLGKLPPKATSKKFHGLNATQIMLKEKGHAIQNSRVGLDFTLPKPVRIAIKRVNNNYVFEGFSSNKDHKREENLRKSVFNRLGPHRKELHGIANRQSVFDSEIEEEDAEDAPVELEEGIKATIDKLKEVNLGNIEDPQPIYISASQTQEEEETNIALLPEFKDVFAWSYKEMPGLDPIIVLVRKKNGQIRVCVDFRDLNNGCHKNDFPLPIVELIIDATMGHEALSFMDGSSRYNQIRMAPVDKELTAFRTPKEIEQAKIDAILRMPEPRNIHELKSLQGKLAYLQRFISSLAGRCQPFNRLMKKDVPFQWDEACDKAFKNIKSYLIKPPVWVAPVPGRPLILYVAAQERSIGILLAQKNDEGKENALYYLSRTMTPNELKYSPIEKLCLALIFSIQKLKHYFQSHSIHLVSRANPLKYVMAKPVLSDRLARWYLQL